MDHTSTRIVSACCRMNEIMEKGITSEFIISRLGT